MTESTPKPEGGPPPELSPRDLFLGLVQSFQLAAMQQLGQVPDPVDQKTAQDLAQAKLSIDMLEMLKTRTEGNLTMEEGRFLDHVLTELRLHYVREAGKGPKG